MVALNELKASDVHWVGSWGRLVVAFWLGDVDPAACREIPELARKFRAEQDVDSLAVVSIALSQTGAPSAEARRELARLVAEKDLGVTRIAVVREGGGFIASAVASVITGIRMLSQSSVPQKPFTELSEAIAWVTEELVAPRWGEQRVLAAVRDIEARRDELESKRPADDQKRVG